MVVPAGHATTLAIVTGAAGAGGGGEGCAEEIGALTSVSAATSSAATPGATPALRRRETAPRPSPRSRGAARVSRALIAWCGGSQAEWLAAARDGGHLTPAHTAASAARAGPPGPGCCAERSPAQVAARAGPAGCCAKWARRLRRVRHSSTAAAEPRTGRARARGPCTAGGARERCAAALSR